MAEGTGQITAVQTWLSATPNIGSSRGRSGVSGPARSAAEEEEGGAERERSGSERSSPGAIHQRGPRAHLVGAAESTRAVPGAPRR